jgi:beta-glucanase (GH16 family)
MGHQSRARLLAALIVLVLVGAVIFLALPRLRAPSPSSSSPTAGAMTLDEECNGPQLNPLFHYDGQWGPGFAPDSDFMGDLRQLSIANGLCTITAARMQTPSGRPYGSAVFDTKHTFSQTYGTFEARIRYPAGDGLWPAFWLNPQGSWPPEIDILEAYPNTTRVPGPDQLFSTLHYPPANQMHRIEWTAPKSLADAFHVFRLVWKPGSLTFSVDGITTGTITSDVPNTPMYPVLDLSVGNWSARAGAGTPDVARMDIDYIRVYAQ